MSDRYGPSEAWMRDAIAAQPYSLIGNVLGAQEFARVRRATGDLDRRSMMVEREFLVPTGRIDLLIVLPGFIIVAEFKRELADESASSQVLRYRGHLSGRFNAPVRAAIVAPRFTAGLISSARAAGIALLVATPMISLAPSLEHPEQLDDESAERIKAIIGQPMDDAMPECPF